MQDQYKISIIIPVYNEGAAINKNLAFVSKLEEDIEVIIIDDGSTDGSFRNLNVLKNKNVKILRQEHKGAGEARNLGIRNATGEYIVFFDADDEFIGQDVLLKLYQKAKKSNENICGGSFCIKNENKLIDKFYAHEEGYTFKKEGIIYFKNYQFDYGFQRFIYRTEFLKKNKIVFPAYLRYQDPPFLVNAMFCAEKFYVIPDVTYIYNERNHIIWDESKILDLVRGLFQNLQFASSQNLYRLYWLNLRRIYMDFFHIITKNSIAQKMINDMEDEKTIQQILFPQKEICMESDLYFRMYGNGNYDYEKSRIILDSNARVEMDSYFNAFSAGKWKEYTCIKNVDCLLELKGNFRIFVYNKRILYGKIEEKLVQTYTIFTKELKKIPIQIGNVEEGGVYTISIEACDDGCIVRGGCYISYDRNMNKNIQIALIMCTYKREQYVEENINRLLTCRDEYLKKNIFTYIIDNAKTLEKRRDFDNIEILHNCNVGGAGGFTKGLLELIKNNKNSYTHCILMDDDIVIDPLILRRTIDFLKNIKEEYKEAFLGGAMLRKDLPYFQVESGATWNQGKITSSKCGLDLRNLYDCLLNEFETINDYNAWWFCVIPKEYIRDDNLPLPLFVCDDDVEFGLRNCKKLILMNGVCVWHDPFESKLKSSRNYYIYRNQLIVNSVRNQEQSRKKLLYDIKNMMYNEIVLYKYENVLAAFEGIKDFCNGPEWLKQSKCDVRNSDIQKYNIEMEDLAKNKVYFDYNHYRFCCTIRDCDWIHKWVRLLTINGLLLKANRSVILPICGAIPVQTYRCNRVVYFDEILNKVLICDRNWKKIFECLFEYFKIRKIIIQKYDKAVVDYKENYKYLISMDFWEEYLMKNQ